MSTLGKVPGLSVPRRNWPLRFSAAPDDGGISGRTKICGANHDRFCTYILQHTSMPDLNADAQGRLSSCETHTDLYATVVYAALTCGSVWTIRDLHVEVNSA